MVSTPWSILIFVKDALGAGVSAFSLDVIPRTTRAQAMDILSSMATVSGYKAVLVAASHLPHFFPMFMTAEVPSHLPRYWYWVQVWLVFRPLQPLKRLGAVVEASDVRQAAREEVLSLGAKFVDVEGATETKSAGGYAVEQNRRIQAAAAAGCTGTP